MRPAWMKTDPVAAGFAGHLEAAPGSTLLKTDQVKRLKDLETENARLRKAISDLTLDKLILQEAAKGNF